MAAKKGGLGKGLDSLIPAAKKVEKSGENAPVSTKNVENSKKSEEVNVKSELFVKIGKVEPNREQPRKNFDEASLADLADSIRQHGVITPLIVRDKGTYYEIIAGERRWRAARMAGLKEVPVVVREYSDEENAQVALIENLLREDLNAIEEAQAYQKLIDDFGMTHETVAEKVSKSRAAVTNSLRLLRLPEKVRKMIEEGSLTGGHARTLLSLQSEDLQEKVAEYIVRERLSVRAAEKLCGRPEEAIGRIIDPKAYRAEKPAEDDRTTIFYKKMETDLADRVGAKVRIRRRSADKGRIEIDYTSLDELERIGSLLKRLREE